MELWHDRYRKTIDYLDYMDSPSCITSVGMQLILLMAGSDKLTEKEKEDHLACTDYLPLMPHLNDYAAHSPDGRIRQIDRDRKREPLILHYLPLLADLND